MEEGMANDCSILAVKFHEHEQYEVHPASPNWPVLKLNKTFHIEIYIDTYQYRESSYQNSCQKTKFKLLTVPFPMTYSRNS